MALNGPKSLESTQTSPDAESLAKAIPESRVDRNDGVFRSTTPSSTSSRARSLNQNENATVSQSPNRGELPEGLSASKGSLEGAAQAIDDAGLLGSDGPIQRSRLANAGGNSSSVLRARHRKPSPLKTDRKKATRRREAIVSSLALPTSLAERQAKELAQRTIETLPPILDPLRKETNRVIAWMSEAAHRVAWPATARRI